jgi:hypothetical protein
VMPRRKRNQPQRNSNYKYETSSTDQSSYLEKRPCLGDLNSHTLNRENNSQVLDTITQ